MGTVKNSDLLNNEDVRKEIERYKWIESEKAGCDIGFAKASEEWLKRYSDQWIKDHSTSIRRTAGRSAKR